LGSKKESFLEKLKEATHTLPVAKLTPMPKYMKIQKKGLYYKDY